MGKRVYCKHDIIIGCDINIDAVMVVGQQYKLIKFRWTSDTWHRWENYCIARNMSINVDAIFFHCGCRLTDANWAQLDICNHHDQMMRPVGSHRESSSVMYFRTCVVHAAILLPARWASPMSTNIIMNVYVTHVVCPSLFIFCWE